MTSILTFDQQDGPAGSLVVTPVIDHQPLPDLVKAAGVRKELVGLATDFRDYGPLPGYFLAANEITRFETPPDRIFLLLCTCGEYGCGNVSARVEVEDYLVRWSDFIFDFGEPMPVLGLGPFEFDRSQYETAAASAF